MKKRQRSLRLQKLQYGMPAITPALGKYCAEVGAVCLEEEGHEQGAVLTVAGTFQHSFQLKWPVVTDQMKRMCADPDEATEMGACAIAFLLIRELTDFTIIQRSYKSTGIDYWLGHKNDFLFQNAARLEVSGIRHGDQSTINKRVKQKTKQTIPSDGMIPAYIVVVEFSAPQSHMIRKTP